MQVGMAPPPIGQARDLDLAEHGQQPALVACLHAAPRHSVGAHHHLQAPLALGTQVQVVLEHLAEQLAALHLQALLQFAMGELARLRPLQPTRNPVESIAGSGEGRRGLVLNVVGSGGEYRVQSGASVVGVDNLPTGASPLQLHLAGTTTAAPWRPEPTILTALLRRPFNGAAPIRLRESPTWNVSVEFVSPRMGAIARSCWRTRRSAVKRLWSQLVRNGKLGASSAGASAFFTRKRSEVQNLCRPPTPISN